MRTHPLRAGVLAVHERFERGPGVLRQCPSFLTTGRFEQQLCQLQLRSGGRRVGRSEALWLDPQPFAQVAHSQIERPPARSRRAARYSPQSLVASATMRLSRIGNRNQNVLPTPGVLSAPIVPSINDTN